MEPHKFFADLFYSPHFFSFLVNNRFSSVFHANRWSPLCTVAAILCVAMQQNASYLRPFSVVSRFRSTTQNN